MSLSKDALLGISSVVMTAVALVAASVAIWLLFLAPNAHDRLPLSFIALVLCLSSVITSMELAVQCLLLGNGCKRLPEAFSTRVLLYLMAPLFVAAIFTIGPVVWYAIEDV